MMHTGPPKQSLSRTHLSHQPAPSFRSIVYFVSRICIQHVPADLRELGLWVLGTNTADTIATPLSYKRAA